jgi:hypothetical protein
MTDADLGSRRVAIAMDAAPFREASASPAFDAGVNACRLIYGPVEQDFVGAAALSATESGIELITASAGIPNVKHLALPPSEPPYVGRVAIETERPHVSTQPCAVAGNEVYCMDAHGAITRSPRSGGVGTVVAKGRPGTRLSATTLADTHSLVAFVAERQTSGGLVSEVLASADGAPPIRISEEGSGATGVSLAPRGAGAIAMMIDARSAMTPVHARSITLSNDVLGLGRDEVVFVGGGAESQTSGTLALGRANASTPAPLFALVAVAAESGFGMAAVHIGDPPTTDEKVVWSMYPNGLDPAPIAATKGASAMRVARLRPVESRSDAARGVELGKLDENGSFSAYGMISTTGRVTSLEVAADSTDRLWIFYTDAIGSWLERRVCP